MTKEPVEQTEQVSKTRSFISYLACKMKFHRLDNKNYCHTCSRQH